jgi:hypothetical protein
MSPSKLIGTKSDVGAGPDPFIKHRLQQSGLNALFYESIENRAAMQSLDRLIRRAAAIVIASLYVHYEWSVGDTSVIRQT